MKTKYIVGGVIIVIALTISFFSLDKSKIEYTNLLYAKDSGKRVQVKGVWVKEGGAEYNTQANMFTFTMKDTDSNSIKVRYKGPRPNNFELAESIVVKGKTENGEFAADEILTKCPSKYEGNVEELKKSGKN